MGSVSLSHSPPFLFIFFFFVFLLFLSLHLLPCPVSLCVKEYSTHLWVWEILFHILCGIIFYTHKCGIKSVLYYFTFILCLNYSLISSPLCWETSIIFHRYTVPGLTLLISQCPLYLHSHFFFLDCLIRKVKEMQSGITCSMTQCHIPDDLNLQKHRCEDLKCCTLKGLPSSTQSCCFSCLADIVWYRNDKAIRNTKNIQIRIKDKKTSCTILKVTPEDEGTYVCKATSDIGTSVTKAKLQVKGN